MKLALILLTVAIVAVVLLVLASDLFAVFPSRPVVASEETPFAARTFVEVPRTLPDGQRFAPRPTETIVVILVEFPADTVDCDTTAVVDTCAAFTFDADHDTAYYNQKIFSEQAGTGTMDNYWDECSLGAMDITGIVIGPYTMPHCIKYYGWDTPGVLDDGWLDDDGNTDGRTCAGGNASGSCRLIGDAVVAADNDINYCQYDTDCDGNVDHVMIVHAGQGQEGSNADPATIWSYFYSGLAYGPFDAPNVVCPNAPGGALVSCGFIVPEYYNDIDKFPLGSFCHEFSHSIGNPDLYDISPGDASAPDDDDNPVADWCLMDHGSWSGPTGTAESPSHLCAFNKIGSGWVNVKVVPPTQVTTSYTIYDLETSAQIPQGANGQVLQIFAPGNLGDYFLVENRDPRDQNADFDKYDSDWSDWTGNGGPDSLDCGLIITHILAPNLHGPGMSNNGYAAYDYVQNQPTCPFGPQPYEVWVEDAGYDDRVNADYDEWWYPWEVKGGAAYAESSADDPHYLWNAVNHANANCTRTASSIDGVGAKATNVSIEATSDCGTQMTADIFVPGWVPVIPVTPEEHTCTEWITFHHDAVSAGWSFGGGIPDEGQPWDGRLRLKWSAPSEVTATSSAVVTNTDFQPEAGEPVHGFAVTASGSGVVNCYSAEDGRPMWTANLGTPVISTPVAVDTLFGRGVQIALNRVYVATNNRVYYINLLDGAVQGYWEAPAPNMFEASPRIAWAQNPAGAQFLPLVFIGSNTGTMYALNASGASLRWQYNIGAPISAPVAMGRPQAQVGSAVRFDAVYIGTMTGSVTCLVAYSGAYRWTQTVAGPISASPAVCDSVTQTGISSQSDETVVVATGTGQICALDATTGGALWSYTASTNPIGSSPSVAVDRPHNWGMIWFQSTDGNVYCLHLGAPKGTSRQIWSYATGGATISSPGVVLPYGMLPLGFDAKGVPVYPPEGAAGDCTLDGVVYLGCGGGGGGGGGRVIALNAANGDLVWDYDMPAPVMGSPAPTLGALYVAADQLYCFGPDETSGVAGGEETGVEFALAVGPNPAGSSTTIAYGIPVTTRVSLKVFDVRGRLVRSIVDGVKAPGEYKTAWDARNHEGSAVASGIYFIRLDAGGRHISRKAVLVR